MYQASYLPWKSFQFSEKVEQHVQKCWTRQDQVKCKRFTRSCANIGPCQEGANGDEPWDKIITLGLFSILHNRTLTQLQGPWESDQGSDYIFWAMNLRLENLNLLLCTMFPFRFWFRSTKRDTCYNLNFQNDSMRKESQRTVWQSVTLKTLSCFWSAGRTGGGCKGGHWRERPERSFPVPASHLSPVETVDSGLLWLFRTELNTCIVCVRLAQSWNVSSIICS